MKHIYEFQYNLQDGSAPRKDSIMLSMTINFKTLQSVNTVFTKDVDSSVSYYAIRLQINGVMLREVFDQQAIDLYNQITFAYKKYNSILGKISRIFN